MPKASSKPSGSNNPDDGSTQTAAHAKGTVTVTKNEYAAFQLKLQRFRKSLSAVEQTIIDSILKGAPSGTVPQAARQPGDRDSIGATKISGNQIRDADGSVTTCPAGSHVEDVDDGMGNFNWLCVSG